MNLKKSIIKNIVIGTTLSIASCTTLNLVSSEKVSAFPSLHLSFPKIKIPKVYLSIPKLKMPKLHLSLPKFLKSRSSRSGKLSSNSQSPGIIANPYADVNVEEPNVNGIFTLTGDHNKGGILKNQSSTGSNTNSNSEGAPVRNTSPRVGFGAVTKEIVYDQDDKPNTSLSISYKNTKHE